MQSARSFSGFREQGKDPRDAKRVESATIFVGLSCFETRCPMRNGRDARAMRELSRVLCFRWFFVIPNGDFFKVNGRVRGF